MNRVTNVEKIWSLRITPSAFTTSFSAQLFQSLVVYSNQSNLRGTHLQWPVLRKALISSNDSLNVVFGSDLHVLS